MADAFHDRVSAEILAAAEKGGLSDLPDTPATEADVPDPALILLVKDLDHRSGLHCAVHPLTAQRLLTGIAIALAAPEAARAHFADVLAAMHAARLDWTAWQGSIEATVAGALSEAQAHVTALDQLKGAQH